MSTPGQAEIEKTQAALKHAENKTVKGAENLTARQKMLDARALREKNPGKHYRYLSSSDANKFESRLQDYKKVDEKEAEAAGVRARVGPMVLVECPREEHEARLADIARKNRERLQAPKNELRTVIEGVAKELRDKHGLDVNTDKLFVNEG